MSYILDSLKKSDTERKEHRATSRVALNKPAFLDNDKPSGTSNHLRWFLVIGGLLMAIAAFVYWQKITLIFDAPSERKPSASLTKPVPDPSPPPAQTISASKAEAISLYQQALSQKTQTEVDSLYRQMKAKKAEQLTLAQSSGLESTDSVDISNTPLAAEVLDSQSVTPVNTPAALEVAVVEQEASIPSIYQLDAYFRKTIPSIDYGAHIYATDNDSGFVILDGARRRVGDKLDSGLYVEQIREASVVLSYNGTVFSLPAMKSWQGK